MPYKIIFDKKSCIGAGECEVLSPSFWMMKGDGKADLAGAVFNKETGMFEKIISDKEMTEQKNVAGSCPVGCIQIKKV